MLTSSSNTAELNELRSQINLLEKRNTMIVN